MKICMEILESYVKNSKKNLIYGNDDYNSAKLAQNCSRHHKIRHNALFRK